MTLTLLLDLDDTCLGNSMDTFIPAYLQLLADHFSSMIPSDKLIPFLLSSTQAMYQNNRPDKKLKEVFDEAFFPPLGIDGDDFQSHLDVFYREKYPQLKDLTQFLPLAVEMVKGAFNRGYTVAIATNPIFPLTAITQRMEWARLSPEVFPFRLIPSYESFYFAKPNPAYFAEILSRMGWPEDPVVMVGDDYQLDISAAQQMGLATFWISNGKQTPQHSPQGIHSSGQQSDLLPWLDSFAQDDLLPDYASIDAMLAILRTSPAVLTAFSEDLYENHWIEHPQPSEWSFTEILCHLRDVDKEVNIPRVGKVLSEENPFLSGMDTDQWADERQYYCQNGSEALNDFITSRIRLLDILEVLKPEDLERQARHAIFGPTNLQEMIGIISGHDQLHVRQALQTLGEFKLRARSGESALDKSH